MIVPFTSHTNRQGNIVFTFEHLPNNKKHIQERLETCWLSTHEFDPVTEEIIHSECSCPDFQLNRMGDSPCKHITEALLALIIIKW